MSLDTVTLRAATLDDLAGIAAIYNQLWCNTLRNRGDVEAADFCARFNIAMQLQRSPIALVAEAEGRIIAACCIGIFEDGKPRTNPTWEPCYNEMFVQATEMAKTADAKLEGAELAKAGCTKFFLMSDCNSDWQFYEHLNMKRILEDHSQDTGDGFIVYMYGGDTQD